ncbi:SGNH/GDSL hydrolase family protein [Streptomyces fuscigenes]|uniref:SGNH/GDSL hydrolase family protein n=1 Tax=Streptomyces fuscigenes TaxID=1528880 RepID=UPI001F32C50D|nr:SGNH/GDSL hydrolase family protein [Streptomyces fuscigenes]MCF3962252.1 SGNH/GDSL hydrolase family protein [Streptomyces fuscigenes]
MTRQRGLAVFAAMIAVVGLVCAGIFVGLGPGRGVTDEVASGLLGHGDEGSTSVAVDGTDGRAPGSGAAADGQDLPHRAAPAASGAWTGTWAAGPVGAEPGLPHGLPGRSIRNIVHTSIGGTAARVTVSNLYGTAPLYVAHASVAVAADGGPTAVPGTMRRLSFGDTRSASVIVPVGRQAVSLPVALGVPADADLLLTLYTPAPGGAVTYHAFARQTSYLAQGDRTEDTSGAAYAARSFHWRYVTAVDVSNRDAAGTVVAFGDSITDGIGSTLDRNRRWPDFLASRMRQGSYGRYGVVDEGIGGNQVLRDASAKRNGRSGVVRFGDDALARPGVRAVFVDLGVNDILHGHQLSGAPIVAGLKNIVRQAHAHDLRVVGSTLTPFGSHAGYDATKERVRDEVNAAIRAGGVFDSVVDFDRVLRDPYAPNRLAPAYDSGDGLHPSDAGYQAMASAVDLRTLLGTRTPAAT